MALSQTDAACFMQNANQPWPVVVHRIAHARITEVQLRFDFWLTVILRSCHTAVVQFHDVHISKAVDRELTLPTSPSPSAIGRRACLSLESWTRDEENGTNERDSLPALGTLDLPPIEDFELGSENQELSFELIPLRLYRHVLWILLVLTYGLYCTLKDENPTVNCWEAAEGLTNLTCG